MSAIKPTYVAGIPGLPHAALALLQLAGFRFGAAVRRYLELEHASHPIDSIQLRRRCAEGNGALVVHRSTRQKVPDAHSMPSHEITVHRRENTLALTVNAPVRLIG